MKALLLLTSVLSVISASAQVDLPISFEQYVGCESTEEKRCDDLFQKALLALEAMAPDTARAELSIRLAEIRKDNGIWDDTVEGLFIESENLYQEAGHACGVAAAKKARCAFYLYGEKSAEAISLAEQALVLAKQCGDEMLIAKVHNTFGVALQKRGSYTEALDHHRASAMLFRKLGDLEGQAVSSQEAANVMASMGDLEEANAMMLESARIYLKIGEEIRYASCITDLCANFLTLRQPDSVLKYQPSARDRFVGKHKFGEALATYNMGEALMQKKQYREALDLYDQTSELASELGSPRLNMEIEISRSECYTGMGAYQKAYERILAAEDIAEEITNVEGLMNILLYKMYTAHDVEDHEASYQAALEYIELKDSIRSVARDEQVAAMQEALEAEKREHKIALLEQEVQLEKQKYMGLSAIIALVLLGAALVTNREVQRRKKARQLHHAEIELRKAKEARLNEELDFKKRELASKALQIAQKNEVLESLRSEIKNISLGTDADKSVTEVLNTLKMERSVDDNWDEFTRQFQEVNPEFYQRLHEKAEGMTNNDLRLAALLRMNLSSKDVASVLNITPEGVKKARQRFRKKLELASDQNLEKFLIEL